MVKAITDAAFEQETKDGLVLIDFWEFAVFRRTGKGFGFWNCLIHRTIGIEFGNALFSYCHLFSPLLFTNA